MPAIPVSARVSALVLLILALAAFIAVLAAAHHGVPVHSGMMYDARPGMMYD